MPLSCDLLITIHPIDRAVPYKDVEDSVRIHIGSSKRHARRPVVGVDNEFTQLHRVQYLRVTS